MGSNGFIKLYRSILEWEWYDDPNTFRVFIHLLLTANYKNKRWHGIDVPKGSRLGSYRIIAEELRMSEHSVRTAIKHLKVTGEVSSKSFSKTTVFRVENYDSFQDVTSTRTGKCQASDKQVTSNGQASDKLSIIYNKKERKKEGKKERMEEYARLCEIYGEELIDAYLDKVKDYEQSTGKIYADELTTAKRWIKRDIERGEIKETSLDVSELEKYQKEYLLKEGER